MKRVHLILAGTILMGCVAACSKEGTTAENNNSPPANPPVSATQNADNTGRNVIDRNAATTTPTDQGENASDLEITRQIRRAIMNDKSLSLNAQNIKIVTSQGIVTLRGPVNTADEKSAIAAKAQAVSGVTRVDDQTEVKTQ